MKFKRLHAQAPLTLGRFVGVMLTISAIAKGAEAATDERVTGRNLGQSLISDYSNGQMPFLGAEPGSVSSTRTFFGRNRNTTGFRHAAFAEATRPAAHLSPHRSSFRRESAAANRMLR